MPKPKPPAFTRADLETVTEIASQYCLDNCPLRWVKPDEPVVVHDALCVKAQALREKLAKGVTA